MTKFLKVARNKNNEWRYIINQDHEDYVQGILIEKCVRCVKLILKFPLK